MLGQQITRKLM